jgi:hypothetical protein
VMLAPGPARQGHADSNSRYVSTKDVRFTFEKTFVEGNLNPRSRISKAQFPTCALSVNLTAGRGSASFRGPFMLRAGSGTLPQATLSCASIACYAKVYGQKDLRWLKKANDGHERPPTAAERIAIGAGCTGGRLCRKCGPTSTSTRRPDLSPHRFRR